MKTLTAIRDQNRKKEEKRVRREKEARQRLQARSDILVCHLLGIIPDPQVLLQRDPTASSIEAGPFVEQADVTLSENFLSGQALLRTA